MKVIFLDRDDTLLVDKNYMYNVGDIEFMPHAIKALKKLKDDYEIVIVTNQAGIGRGFFTDEDHKTFTIEYIRQLLEEGIKIHHVFVCPHTPQDKCDCRKPETKLVEKFIKNNDVDLKNSWVLGDKQSDMEFADRIGCKSIMMMNMDRASKIILGEEE